MQFVGWLNWAASAPCFLTVSPSAQYFFQPAVWSGAEFICLSICLTKVWAHVPVSLRPSAYPLSHLSLSILLCQSCQVFFVYHLAISVYVAFISHLYTTYLPPFLSYHLYSFAHCDSVLHICCFIYMMYTEENHLPL